MKFKNIKKNPDASGKKPKSPSNSRTIPAFTNVSADRPVTFIKIYRLSLKVFIVFIFILAVIVVGLDLHANIQAKQTIDLERGKLTKELKFWEDFIVKRQDYQNAYFQASVLEYKLGDTIKAKKYAGEGLSLDPNSGDASKLEKFLEGK